MFFSFMSLFFMSFSYESNTFFKEEVKVELSNFDQASFSISLSDFKNYFSEILNFDEEDHHACNAQAGPLTCSATCQDNQNCSCNTGQYWWGGYYCNCSCSGGGNQ